MVTKNIDFVLSLNLAMASAIHKINGNILSTSGEFYTDSQGVSKSYREFERAIANIKIGLPQRSKVAIVGEKDFIHYAAIIATFLSGGVWIPLSLETPLDRNSEIIKNSQTDLLLCGTNVPKALLESANSLGVDILCLDQLDVLAETTMGEPVEVADDELAIIYHTSGSTGIPKGVKITHRGIDAALSNIAHLFAENGKLWGDYHDLSFVISINVLFKCVFTQGRIFCANAKLDQISPGAPIQQSGVQVLVTVPSTLKRITTGDDFIECLGSIESLVSCGEPLPLDLMKKLLRLRKARVFNFYGSTELTTWCCYHECSDKDFFDFQDYGYAPIGKLISGFKCKIEESGKFLLAGPQVTSGYLGDAKDKHIEIDDGIEWFFSGDIVENRDGLLICKGRADNVIKINGFRVHLMDIETNVKAIDGVESCLSFLEEIDNKKLISLCVVLTKNIQGQSIRQELSRRIQSYMIPKRIYRLATTPTNKNGKMDRTRMKSSCRPENLI